MTENLVLLTIHKITTATPVPSEDVKEINPDSIKYLSKYCCKYLSSKSPNNDKGEIHSHIDTTQPIQPSPKHKTQNQTK